VVLGGGGVSYERGTPAAHLGMQELDMSRMDLVQWFRGGLVFKAHKLLYHSTLGLRVVKKKKHLGLQELDLSRMCLPPRLVSHLHLHSSRRIN